ncbi:MAG: sulfatase-like hydrolase/transferase [Pirellulales bacterium]|nr:sulfatase-like hydrolase/transferase [Pirellulales bacterium]
MRFCPAAIGFLLLLVASVAARAAPPNVLLLMGDDHAPYVTGTYGNRQVRTPHLDRLAAAGMRFDRAFCNSPVCTASRQSLITGRYPRTIGVTQLATPLPESETTLAELLKAAGYDTAAIGKMHFNSQLQHGFDHRIDLPEYRQWLTQQPSLPLPTGVETLGVWRPFRDPASVWLNAACRPFASVDARMSGAYFAAQADQWLRQSRAAPFFLVVSFYEPHSPFHFPVEYAHRHAASEFNPPPVDPRDLAQIPQIFRDLTDDQKRGIIAAHHTSVEYLDQNIGRVLHSLEQTGHADDTLVIYLGDHGYLLGQHGRFEKHTSYEEAIRAALLMRYPPWIPNGGGADAMVKLVDLLPTVLDACGVAPPATTQGRSLRGVLTGAASTHRDAVFVEYAPNEEACLRTSRWKIVYRAGQHVRADGYKPSDSPVGQELALYDLESDPHELTNLADDPAAAPTRDELLAQLLKQLRATARPSVPLPSSDEPMLRQLEALVQPHDLPGA